MKQHSHIRIASTPRFSVWHDQVAEAQALTDYFYVSKPDAVLIVLHDSKSVLLLEVDRYLIGNNLEIPGGRIEPNELPRDAANRELLEECGISTSNLTHVITIYPLPSVATEKVHVFFAEIDDIRKTMLTDTGKRENIRRLQVLTFAQAKLAAATGRIKCAVDAFAIFLFLETNEENEPE